MSGSVSRNARIIDPRRAGTSYGQSPRSNHGLPQHIQDDVRITEEAANQWKALRKGIQREIKSADAPRIQRPRMGLKLSANREVSGLRGAIRNLGNKVGPLFTIRRAVQSGRKNDALSQFEANTQLPHFRKKLELLGQFDRSAGAMRGTTFLGGSKADKVASDMAGLSEQALGNVNVDLKDDILLAQGK